MMMTLQDVYAKYRKHLYIENTHLIDVSLATYITKDLPGKPLWIVPVGPSSYGKTTIASFLPFLEKQPDNDTKYRVLKMDQTSAKAFASGARGNKDQDYGEWLQNNRSMIYFPDMASLLASSESRQIFALFRNLYDGDIMLSTGTKKLNYEHCLVNMLGFSTPKIRSDIEFMSAMGTRELVYTLPEITEPKKMYPHKVTDEKLQEINTVIKKFIDGLSEKTKEPDMQTKKDIATVAETISVLRAEGITTDEGLLKEPVEQEYPKRLYDQLIKLWQGMEMIGVADEQKKSVIHDIEKGSGPKLRRRILYQFFGHTKLLDAEMAGWLVTLDLSYPNGYSETIRKISNKLVTSPHEVTREISVLASLGLIRPIEGEPKQELKENENGEKVWVTQEDSWSYSDLNTKWVGVEEALRKDHKNKVMFD